VVAVDKPFAGSRAPAPTRVRWLIFGLACAVSWLLYLHRYSWGVVKPAFKAEHPELAHWQLGALDSMFNVTYAAGQVPGGLAADGWGPRAVLSLLILAWSAAVAGLAGAPGFWAVAAVLALFGLAQAGAYPCLSQVTRRWFPLSVRTAVQGAVASLSGRAGGACASLLVAALLMGALHLHWRAALVAVASLGLVLAAAFWLLFRDSPAQHPRANEAEARRIAAGPAPADGGRPRPDWSAANVANFGALLLYSFLSTFADQLYVYWLPLYLREAKGLGTAEMGLFAGLPLWGGAVGGAVGGALNDLAIRLGGSRRWGRSAVAFTGKLLAAALIAASLLLADGRLVMLALLACKFFGDWSLSTQWGTITDIAGPASGTVFGVVNTVGGVAAVVASPVMGHLIEAHGWDTLFGAVCAAYVVAAVCWLFIDCTRRLVK
jgi:sugar phosphate permease